MHPEFADLSLDDLVARNQALGAEQDLIRAQRVRLAEEIRVRVLAAPRGPASPGDGVADGALPTVTTTSPE